jgi:hypothetical protein
MRTAGTWKKCARRTKSHASSVTGTTYHTLRTHSHTFFQRTHTHTHTHTHDVPIDFPPAHTCAHPTSNLLTPHPQLPPFAPHPHTHVHTSPDSPAYCGIPCVFVHCVPSCLRGLKPTPPTPRLSLGLRSFAALAHLGFGVQGSGCTALPLARNLSPDPGFRFRVYALGFMSSCLGACCCATAPFGSGFRVCGLGFKVYGFRI